MRIDYSYARNSDFCKFCGHNACLHQLSWDRDHPSRLNVTYCKQCSCDRFSLDNLSYEQHFPITVKRNVR